MESVWREWRGSSTSVPKAILFAISSRSLRSATKCSSRRPEQAHSAGNILKAKESSMSIRADMDIGSIAAIGPFGAPPPSKHERPIAKAKEVPAATTLVVHPCDETTLRGPIEAAEA